MSYLVSIFDIALIVDSICLSLSLHNTQAYRLVNRQWASIFELNLQNFLRLPSTKAFTAEKITALLEHRHWIRSLTVASQHVDKLFKKDLTTLQELVL